MRLLRVTYEKMLYSYYSECGLQSSDNHLGVNDISAFNYVSPTEEVIEPWNNIFLSFSTLWRGKKGILITP